MFFVCALLGNCFGLPNNNNNNGGGGGAHHSSWYIPSTTGFDDNSTTEFPQSNVISQQDLEDLTTKPWQPMRGLFENSDIHVQSYTNAVSHFSAGNGAAFLEVQLLTIMFLSAAAAASAILR